MYMYIYVHIWNEVYDVCAYMYTLPACAVDNVLSYYYTPSDRPQNCGNIEKFVKTRVSLNHPFKVCTIT